MTSNIKRLTALAGILLLASCGKQATKEPKLQAQAQGDLNSATDDAGRNKALLAAAEEFETLTESSFSVDTATRNSMILKASEAAAKVTKFASPDLATQLKSHLADVLTAQRNNKPADSAIASNEAFRALVSAVAGKQEIPVNVSLLDYAGFRFDADAQAVPARFADMGQAVVFAKEQWSGIKSRREIANLSARFSAALDNMERASRSGDVALARAAAKVELDMVDELETAFGQ